MGIRKPAAVAAAMLFAALCGVRQALAEAVAPAEASTVPVARFLMSDKESEIALARSAAPESISGEAEVLVLGVHGFETVVKGKNGFTCMVARSWTSGPDAEFANPKIRVPFCFNAAATRSYLRYYKLETDSALKGMSRQQVTEGLSTAITSRLLPAIESGSMGYMMSKQGYAGDSVDHWPPHLMFFYPQIDAGFWGANLPDSPVYAFSSPAERSTAFVLTTRRWSDGSQYNNQETQHRH